MSTDKIYVMVVKVSVMVAILCSNECSVHDLVR